MKNFNFIISTFVAMVFANSASASNLTCTVTRVAGLFQSFTQPQVGDKLTFDTEVQVISDLQVGSATISTGTQGLKQRPLEGIIQFTAKEQGAVNYTLQLVAHGDNLSEGSLQSITERQGFISVAIAELSCQ